MSIINTIQTKIRQQMVDLLGPQVEDWIVDKTIGEESLRRAEPIKKALDIHANLLDQIKKLDRPDHIIKDKDGKITFEGYTSKRSDELKKLRENVDKLERASDKAFKDGDIKELNQLLQSFSAKPDKKEGGAGTSEEAS